MKLTDYCALDAVGLAGLVRDGSLDAVEVAEAAIAMAEALNPELNAIVTPLYDAAGTTACGVDRKAPLAGVPFLVKDLDFVAGVPCSMGSRYWGTFTPQYDAEIVRRYRAAGLVILGKSNTPEVGLAASTEGSFLGPCRNPWQLSHSPGGSSGGAAAAVAAGIVPAAHGTDGGGSIRGPASCCALVGLKPSRGRISFAPDVGEGWGGLASHHALTRSVRDSAALLDVSHGPAPGDPYHPPYFAGSFLARHREDPGSLRIAIDLKPITERPVHQDCVAAVRKTAALLEDLGHRVEEARPEFAHRRLIDSANRIVIANVANMVGGAANYLNRAPAVEDLEAHTWRCVEGGRQVSAEQYIRALKFTHAVGRAFAAFFESYDLILSPTHLHPPPLLGWLDTGIPDGDQYMDRVEGFWGFTSAFNAAGCPAVSLPMHHTDEGLPIGVQLGAAYGAELLLLQVSRQLEETAPWSVLIPPLLRGMLEGRA